MNDQGGLGLWSSSPETAEFPTVYAAHFLIEAKDRGQKIPDEVLTRLDSWLTRFASTPASTLADARLRAYAVYLLARQGIKPTAALSNVEQELSHRYPKTWPTDLAAAYLASTYRLMQRNDEANRIVAKIPWSTEKRDFGDEVYYDAVVHDAQLLYLLARHFPNRLGATPPAVLETISTAVSGNRVNSLSAAYTLLALDAFAKGAAATTTLGISEIGKDGRERALTLSDGAIRKADLSAAAAKVQFSRRGIAPAYYALNESGFDRTSPTAERSDGVEIIREFLDAKGNPVSRVTVGEEFLVRLRVRATTRERQTQIAIIDLLPSGVEPVLELEPPADSSTRGPDPAIQRQQNASAALPVGLPDKSDWAPSHVDVREDRLVIYGDAGKNAGTFVYRVRANNAGTLPGAARLCRRHVQPRGRRTEPRRHTRGRQAVIRPASIGWRPAIAGLAIALLGLRVWPHAPLRERVPTSTGVWSADGELLRVTLSADDQYRLWVPLSGMSSSVVDAFLLKEDRWFYWHCGVNPMALARAAFRTYRGEHQGGSTLTMQLARLVYRLNTKTPGGKLRQIGAAVWLEARYSKRELLETYLNVVPFGGNIQGVGAASVVYFSKPPDRLTLGESLTLAVIPQRPASRAGRASPAALLSARARLGRLWLKRHGDTDADRRQVELQIVADFRFPLPWQAPHFVDAVLANRAAGSDTGRIDTTLDAGLQRAIELQIRRYLAQREAVGISNAAALLVDARDMSVKAWVGSADYWKPGDGQVNGVLAKRSPGSTLKPFVYALALDQGVLHPQTMLRDAPTSFGPFTPENFDGRFFGPIAAEEALIRSRNVPAVWVASQLRQPNLYQFLQSAGVRDLKPESYYGLALTLGGGELTMEELAGLYAMLANEGTLRPLRSESSSAPVEGVRLLSPEASFITLDMLRRNPRPDDTGSIPVRARWPVAWKTGTSWGFRDAWSAGVVGPYVLVVWIGNFDGRGNPAFIGVDAAAPLFFRVADALNLARATERLPPLAPPAGVSRVAVCTGSGDLPNADCPHTVDTWYIPGKSPIRVSQLHRAVAIDVQTGRPTCPPYGAGTRFEVFEFWPSDMLNLFREAGVPRRTPPALPACAVEDRTEAPRIASPLRNVTYALRLSAPGDRIALDASVAGDVQRIFWFDGSALIGVRAVSEGALPWRPAAAGVHLVRAVDDRGRSADRDVDVQFVR